VDNECEKRKKKKTYFCHSQIDLKPETRKREKEKGSEEKNKRSERNNIH
jgi:hypothetical protein